MSKTWYPMVDYEKCTECGACIDMCPYGVYDKTKSPRPVVANPDGCGQGCSGCGDICPSEAITYFGDTGETENTGCCGGDCDCSSGCCCGEDTGTTCDCGSKADSASDKGCGCS